MTFKTIAPTLCGLGYETLPLWPGKKNPSIDGWQSVEITEAAVAQWASNGKADHGVGVRTGTGKVAIYGADNDILDKGVAVAVRKSFVEHFGEGIVRVGQAPKSLMVYSGAPGAVKITSPTWVSPDGQAHKFEFLGAGQQFVAFGVHEKTGLEYRWPSGSILDLETWELIEIDPVEVRHWVTDVLPTLIPADWVVKGGGSSVVQPTDAAERTLLNFKPKLDMTWDEVKRSVLVLDADMDHDTWVSVMMAVHHQSGGDEDGLALAHEWSAKGKDYKKREVDAKWRSMKDDPSRGRVTTMATVLKMVQELAPEVKQEIRQSWEEKIGKAADQYAVADLAAEIGKDRSVSPIDLAKLAGLIQNKLKTFDVKMPIAEVRGLIKPRKTERSNGEGVPMEDWCENYVWCCHTDTFINIVTQELISVQSFNATHGRNVRNVWMTADGFQMAAAQVALQEIQIPVVARRMYLPWALQFFNYDGMCHLNSYRPSSVPDEKESWEWTDEDRDVIAKVEGHVATLIGAVDASVVLDWMAWTAQNPGKKIKWSILIKGMEGDGKSFLGNVMEAVMGLTNVGRVSPKVLNTDFNGWAEGHCVCVVEELKLTGHNRHDVLNALKELHTNSTVTIHRKGVDSYPVCNTQNYMAFTNYTDAIPVTDGDRRWFVSFSRFINLEQLMAAGMNQAYFDALFKAIEEHAPALRHWLLSRDVSLFEPNGRAPASMAKSAMVAASASDDEETIKEIIETGIVGVSKHVVSTSHLTTHMLMEYPDVDVPKGHAVAAIMSRLGFYKVEKRVKWNGSAIRAWVTDISVIKNNADGVRRLLDATNSILF